MSSITNANAVENCDNTVDKLDVGTGTATLVLYESGSTPPARVDEALGSPTTIATFNLPNPAFGGAVDDSANNRALATANSITGVAASSGGTPDFARAFDRDGNAVMQMSVGTSGTDIILTAATATSGQTINITSWTHSVPEDGS